MKKLIMYILIVVVVCLLGLNLFFVRRYKKMNQRYQEEKLLFETRKGEIINLKDDVDAFRDSMHLARKQFQKFQDSIIQVK